MKPAGHEVAAAADGWEGLGLFQQQAFDLVITDVLMPRKGGAETIADLRRLRPGLKIVAACGGGRSAGTGCPATAQSLGADRLLTKPFTVVELRAAVADVLRVANKPPTGS